MLERNNSILWLILIEATAVTYNSNLTIWNIPVNHNQIRVYLHNIIQIDHSLTLHKKNNDIEGFRESHGTTRGVFKTLKN